MNFENDRAPSDALAPRVPELRSGTAGSSCEARRRGPRHTDQGRPGSGPSAGNPPVLIDWDEVPSTDQPGRTGSAVCRAFERGPLRIQLVDYSPGYKAAGWCSRTHAVHCLDGVLLADVSDGSLLLLMPGMTHVTDGTQTHCYSTEVGARVLVVDAAEMADLRPRGERDPALGVP